jgi:prepilin-type N-terminal cleavage/methylation domain-containing protein
MRIKRKPQGFTLLEIMLVVSIIVIILGVAISKLGNTTAIAKTMRVQADVQAIKTQLQLYESMNGFYPTTEPDGISYSKNCQKIHGEMTTFIAPLVSRTQAVMTCIPPGRTGRPILQTTIGAAVNRPES